MKRACVLCLVAIFGFASVNAVSAQNATPITSSVPTSGIPYVAENDVQERELVDAIRARRGGKLLNLDRMLLNSPSFARGWNSMFGAIRGQLALDPKLRELAIMAIAVLNNAEYEWVQHEGEFLSAGGTKEQLAALRDVSNGFDVPVFDDAERATLALTTEMTRSVTVQPSTMRRIRGLLKDQHVVELVGTIAGYNMVSRFLVATGIGLDENEHPGR